MFCNVFSCTFCSIRFRNLNSLWCIFCAVQRNTNRRWHTKMNGTACIHPTFPPMDFFLNSLSHKNHSNFFLERDFYRFLSLSAIDKLETILVFFWKWGFFLAVLKSHRNRSTDYKIENKFREKQFGAWTNVFDNS